MLPIKYAIEPIAEMAAKYLSKPTLGLSYTMKKKIKNYKMLRILL